MNILIIIFAYFIDTVESRLKIPSMIKLAFGKHVW